MNERRELAYRDPFRIETHSTGIPGVNGYAKVRVSDPRSGFFAKAEGPDQIAAMRQATAELYDQFYEAAMAERR